MKRQEEQQMANAEGLLKKFSTAKTLPHMAVRLTRLIADDNSTMQDFEAMIKMDPTMVLRLLRVANSPYFGLRQKVNSISRAVVVLGMNNLRNMIVTDSMKNIFKESQPHAAFSRNRLWLHCAAVAICSQMIMERIFGLNGEDAFLCGILHDIGMIVEDQTAHDLFVKTCESLGDDCPSVIFCEKKIIGTDHCEIGHLLARDWQFSAEICEGIQQHHQKLDQVSSSSMTGVIQLSEYIVSRLNYPAIPGMKATLSPPLTIQIRDNVKEYKALARDLPDEMSKAKDLYAPFKEQN
jgi:putative nucleotidyltransferase with HDIG domain